MIRIAWKNVLKSHSATITTNAKEIAKENLIFVTLRINSLSNIYEKYSPKRIERFLKRISEIAKQYHVPDKDECVMLYKQVLKEIRE